MFHQGSNNQLHPKLLKLAEILKTFFQNNSGKAMVFTQLRISAKEIKEYLQGIDIIKS
jgi:ERCC4-related helicase